MWKFSDPGFNRNGFVRFFALTLVAALLVGNLAVSAGAPDPLLQAVLVALLVGLGAGFTVAPRRAPAPGPVAPQTATGSDARVPAGRTPDRLEQAPDGLAETGITTKALELIALGERYGNAFSVALVGIDHLDEIRKQYGSRVAGELLDRVGVTLAHTLRMPDRVGEFEHHSQLVILPETALPGAMQIAERLCAAVAGLEIAVSGRRRIQTTASVGLTCFRRGDDLHSLLRRAARAQRQAQRQGRNRVLSDLAA